MTRETKQTALLLARVMIENRSEHLICSALIKVAMEHHSLRDTSDYLRSYIMKKLESVNTLRQWLFENNLRHTDEAARTARLQWIDWMIENAQ